MEGPRRRREHPKRHQESPFSSSPPPPSTTRQRRQRRDAQQQTKPGPSCLALLFLFLLFLALCFSFCVFVSYPDQSLLGKLRRITTEGGTHQQKAKQNLKLWPKRGLYGEGFSLVGQPVFSLGLISDLQYVDKPNRRTRGMTRYYRHSMRVLEQAMEAWKLENITQVVVLGDTIDMSSRKKREEEVEVEMEMEMEMEGKHPLSKSPTETLKAVVDKLRAFAKVHFVLGNHDVASIPRPELLNLLGLRGNRRKTKLEEADENDDQDQHDDNDNEVAYYSEMVETMELEASQQQKKKKKKKKVKMVFLDSFDVSVYWPESHKRRALADRTLREKRRFFPASLDKSNLKSSAMLFGLDKRFVSLGGGLGEKQLQWLEKELEESCKRDTSTKVVVFSHIPIFPSVCSKRCGYTCLLWNYDEVNRVLVRSNKTSGGDSDETHDDENGSGCVKAYFAGHDHRGGYAYDSRSGVHHTTLFGAIEAGPEGTAFAVLDFYESPEGVVLRGAGNIQSRWMPF